MKLIKTILLLVLSANIAFCKPFDTDKIDSEFINSEVVVEYMHPPIIRENLPGYMVVLNRNGIRDEVIKSFLNSLKLGSRSFILLRIKKNKITSHICLPVENGMIVVGKDNRVACLVERDIFYRHISGELKINWDKWKNIDLLGE